MTSQAKLDWINMARIVLSASICSFIGMALAPLITKLNNHATYGEWASYFVVLLLFYILNFNVKVIKMVKEGKK